MAYYPYFGFFSFQETLTQWEQIGVFDILLPMLLIFTVVYAILDRTKIFGQDKKPINAVVALVISFLTIQNTYVTGFFKILFSQVALGIAILLAVVLLTGLVMGNKQNHLWKFVIMILGFVVFIWMLSRAADEYQTYYGVYAFGLFTSTWWAANASWIVLLVFILIIVGIIVGSGSKTPHSLKDIAKDWIGEEE